MTKYLVFAVLLTCSLSTSLYADMPPRPPTVYNPITVGLFGGMESQLDSYNVNADRLFPEGGDLEMLSGVQVYGGISLVLPFKSIRDHRTYQAAFFSLGYHKSAFEIEQNDVAATKINILTDFSRTVPGTYSGLLEREHVEFEASWFRRGAWTDLWLKFGVSIQYTLELNRQEQLQVAQDSLGLPRSERFLINDGGAIAIFENEAYAIDPWSIGLIGGVGYNFYYGRIEYGPSFALVYNLTNIDGEHASWRRLSTRLAMNFNIRLGPLKKIHY